MSDLNMTRVPVLYLDKVWGRVEPFLKRAVDVSRGRYDMPSLYEEVKAARQQLWVIYTADEEIVCSFTTQFMYYPLRVNLSVSFIGSDDNSISKEDWVDIVLELMDWGRVHGCSGFESVGRRAWGRIFKDIGFEETFTIVESEI
tara:strand:- start:757 stop:1188 length:432 start_codon:yes stop_codon:yes gene_type:complete